MICDCTEPCECHKFLDNTIFIDYTEVGSLDLSKVANETAVNVFLDREHKTFLTSLYYWGGKLQYCQDYLSPTEFATIEMKTVLTMFVKRKVVSLDPTYYTPDDPKLHGFISKLSYEGIKYVADHVVEFAEAFKQNKVSELLNIPKPGKKHRS
jgi:hypothetical protein